MRVGGREMAVDVDKNVREGGKLTPPSPRDPCSGSPMLSLQALCFCCRTRRSGCSGCDGRKQLTRLLTVSGGSITTHVIYFVELAQLKKEGACVGPKSQ